MEVFRIAWRNVWRNRRRSLVTIAAMSLALTVMILYAGLMKGYLEGMERNIVSLEIGDLQIFANDYRNDPSIYTRIEEAETLVKTLEDDGFRVAPRLLAFGLAASGESSAGVSFRGIDLARDAEASDVHEEVARGRWLDAADPKGVVIGKRLARTLDTHLGSELVVLTTGADGAMAYDLFTVRGILRAIGDATDRAGVFVQQDVLRELILVPQGVHQIIVRRPAELRLTAAAEIARRLAALYDVQTWRELLPSLASLLDSAEGVIIVMFFIVYVAIAILILNAMLMAVFERIREFGVLKAIGAGPGEVLSLIVIESAVQVGLAVLVGVLVSIPGAIYLRDTGIDLLRGSDLSVMGVAMDPIWRASVTAQTFSQPIVVLVAIVAVAITYPALKAAFIQPVEAMRRQ